MIVSETKIVANSRQRLVQFNRFHFTAIIRIEPPLHFTQRGNINTFGCGKVTFQDIRQIALTISILCQRLLLDLFEVSIHMVNKLVF
jgi:hypothetical protein